MYSSTGRATDVFNSGCYVSTSSRHVYDYDIDLTSDVAPARVLRMVRPGSRVLEIGAGPGSITRHLSGSLGCDVVALEIDPTAIERLQPFARAVFSADLNEAGWAEMVRDREGQFDYVIAADVLEHVYDPWSVLGGMKSLLNDTGSVILSLPHVGHAAVAACLIDEDFEYRPVGLLDRTHIRFFGIKNIDELYRSQGLVIEQAEFVVRTPEMTEFARRWRALPAKVQGVLQANRFAHVYQVVSRAVPVERASASVDLMTQQVVPPDPATVDLWERIMASQPVQSARDTRPTLDETRLGGHAATARKAGLAAAKGKDMAGAPVDAATDLRLIAFYLPQFHPIPENDLWWGKGFTEWTNVTKAVPHFDGHYQPHLPADLGFYDLRLREVRHAQIALAKSYGIHGFCYYYYWFSGQRLLERPLNDMLADPESDMPFCLCWANENWTRRWDAAEHEVLIAQRYHDEDDLAFIRSLEPFLRDPRYIRIDGAPLVIVYRPQHMPDAARSVKVWRDHCDRVGIGPLHLACALTFGNWDHTQFGFDSGVEFPPHNMKAPDLSHAIRFRNRYSGYCPDYKDVAEMYLANRYGPDRSVFRGVLPSWDNTARRGASGTVIMNGTPENYEYWLSEAARRTLEEFPGQNRPLFINAWNEWAEGCHLEPDRRYGHRFLETTRRAVAGTTISGWTHVGVPEEVRLPHGAPNMRKSWKSRTFRKVRDTLTLRRLRKGS